MSKRYTPSLFTRIGSGLFEGKFAKPGSGNRIFICAAKSTGGFYPPFAVETTVPDVMGNQTGLKFINRGWFEKQVKLGLAKSTPEEFYTGTGRCAEAPVDA